MADLYDTTKQNISLQINNIFFQGILDSSKREKFINKKIDNKVETE